MFDKRASGGAEVELILTDSTTYKYGRVWSGSSPQWSVTRPGANEWHHLAVVYDAGSTTNDPVMYLDGNPQSLSETTPPVGTPNTNSDGYMLGNRSAGDRTWDGRMAEFAVWDALLTPFEVAQLSAGVSPLTIQFGSLVSYIPLLGVASPEPDLIGTDATVSGATAADHPVFGSVSQSDRLRKSLLRIA
jgi:hypothetical protein